MGWVLIKTSKEWEAGVMTVVSFAQFCLATMTIGLYFFGFKVGSNPFVLLRNEMDAPIFSRPEYLSLIKDGNGLNTLLQNYWMVIHPPVLFLGFASTIIIPTPNIAAEKEAQGNENFIHSCLLLVKPV